jgi:hypothetical protein
LTPLCRNFLGYFGRRALAGLQTRCITKFGVERNQHCKASYTRREFAVAAKTTNREDTPSFLKPATRSVDSHIKEQGRETITVRSNSLGEPCLVSALRIQFICAFLRSLLAPAQTPGNESKCIQSWRPPFPSFSAPRRVTSCMTHCPHTFPYHLLTAYRRR